MEGQLATNLFHLNAKVHRNRPEGTEELEGVGGHHHASAALPPGKTRYPLYRRLLVWTCVKNLGPTGFDPRTVQPVAIRYTD
jgi:hypothetical protein